MSTLRKKCEKSTQIFFKTSKINYQIKYNISQKNIFVKKKDIDIVSILARKGILGNLSFRLPQQDVPTFLTHKILFFPTISQNEHSERRSSAKKIPKIFKSNYLLYKQNKLGQIRLEKKNKSVDESFSCDASSSSLYGTKVFSKKLSLDSSSFLRIRKLKAL